jgi:hypothetical protein
MPVTLHDATLPLFRNMLKALSKILDKAAAHADARKIDPLVLTGDRLYPDMFTLARQVQLSTDFAKGAGARLTGTEIPKYEDTERTIPELKARIEKTLSYLDSLKPAQFEGAETRDIVIKAGSNTYEFKGKDFVFNWALPHFFFHVTTAYNILRHNGVEIGKGDYMGRG